MSFPNVDFAITLVYNEDEATPLDAYDLQYVHKQLMTEQRYKLRAEREFPNHVNKPSKESLDRVFMELPRQHGGKTLHKLMFFSAKETAEVCREEREFSHILWVKVAPVEEYVD